MVIAKSFCRPPCDQLTARASNPAESAFARTVVDRKIGESIPRFFLMRAADSKPKQRISLCWMNAIGSTSFVRNFPHPGLLLAEQARSFA